MNKLVNTSLFFLAVTAVDCPIGTSELFEYANGSFLCIGYDSTATTEEQVIFYASVKQNTYAAIGFGSVMTNTDMIGFYAADNTGDSRC